MQYKVMWWLNRSLSSEYQKAYDNIISKINIPDNSIVCDYACGNGEILRRLRKKFPKIKIVGIDGCKFMLNLAKEVLEQNNFESTTITNENEINKKIKEMKNGEIILFNHDIFNTKLNKETFDYVIFTFPDIIGREITQETILNPENITLDTTKEIERILKKQGITIRVEYEAVKDKESKTINKNLLLENYKILLNDFVHEERLKQDISTIFEGLFGYRIIYLQKS